MDPPSPLRKDVQNSYQGWEGGRGKDIVDYSKNQFLNKLTLGLFALLTLLKPKNLVK